MTKTISTLITVVILKAALYVAVIGAVGVAICMLPFEGHLELMNIAGVAMSGAASVLVCLGLPVWLASTWR